MNSPSHGANEPVAAPGKVSMKRGLSTESPRASRNLIDGGIQAVVEIHERVGGPQVRPELFPSHHFAGPLKQDCEDVKRLVLELKIRYRPVCAPRQSGYPLRMFQSAGLRGIGVRMAISPTP